MIVTIDFETYYDRDYSLSRMSTAAYILDPRFEALLCAVKVGRRPTRMHVGYAAIQRALEGIDWEQAALLSHNTRFDGAIALWRFNMRPRLYLCSLSMARAITHVAARGSSLDKVSRYMGLPDKGHQVHTYIGKRLADFTEAEITDYANYCANDNDNSRMIFDRLRRCVPPGELSVIDLTLRMYIQPQVKLSPTKLANHLDFVQAQRETSFATVAHIPRDVFSSQLKFQKLLLDMGVDVPMKVSPTTGLDIPALARNDAAFRELCDDATQTPEVQAVLAARLGAKSTIEETRTAALMGLGALTWGNDSGWAPVPLKYYGAHTGRHSGDDGYNFLNFKRGSPIRQAIEAPDNFRVVHRDSSQIEARMVAWMAGCQTLLSAFAQGRDIYSEFATDVYGRRITKADVAERHVGKTAILGLGYNMGAPRFKHTLFVGAISVTVSEQEAVRVVYLYRRRYREVPQLWATYSSIVVNMARINDPTIPGERFEPEPGPGMVIQPYSDNAIWLPNGMAIQYLDLRRDKTVTTNNNTGFEFTYDGGPGKGRQRLFGGKVTENISQANSRIIITDVAVRVYHRTGWRPFLCTYDSLDYCVPKDEAPAFDLVLEEEFARRPIWAPTLPLASEGGWGRTLLEAERRVNT